MSEEKIPTFEANRIQKVKELAADAEEPMNMPIADLLERAYDAALDFIHASYARPIREILNSIERLTYSGDPDQACRQIEKLVQGAPRLAQDLEAAEHWTNGWMFDEDSAASRADDLREKGWAVAVHNDYKLPDGMCTFWLMTKRIGNQTIALKGEGYSDRIALDLIREQVSKLER